MGDNRNQNQDWNQKQGQNPPARPDDRETNPRGADPSDRSQADRQGGQQRDQSQFDRQNQGGDQSQFDRQDQGADQSQSRNRSEPNR